MFSKRSAQYSSQRCQSDRHFDAHGSGFLGVWSWESGKNEVSHSFREICRYYPPMLKIKIVFTSLWIFSETEDVVNAIVFLLSDKSSKMIHGITLPCDGGFTCCWNFIQIFYFFFFVDNISILQKKTDGIKRVNIGRNFCTDPNSLEIVQISC